MNCDTLADDSIIFHAAERLAVIKSKDLIPGHLCLESKPPYLDMLSIRSILVMPNQWSIWTTHVKYCTRDLEGLANVRHQSLKSHILFVYKQLEHHILSLPDLDPSNILGSLKVLACTCVINFKIGIYPSQDNCTNGPFPSSLVPEIVRTRAISIFLPEATY